jgi:hypothetical protein
MEIVITICVVGHCALNPALAIFMGFAKSTDGSVIGQNTLSVTRQRNRIKI